MDLGEAIRLHPTDLGISQAALAETAGVDARLISAVWGREQQPLFTVAVAVVEALRVALAKLAGLPAEPPAGPAQKLPRVWHGMEFSARDASNGELRVTGDEPPQRSCGPPHGWTSTATAWTPTSCSGT
jgi:transcriptional regulator with XRE-family HTH domain